MSWRGLSVAMMGLWALLVALPTFLPASWRGHIPSWLPQQPVTLGLDLQGGAHLLLGVEEKQLVAEELTTLVETVRDEFRTERIFYRHLQAVTPNYIRVVTVDAAQNEKTKAVLEKVCHEGLALDCKFWNPKKSDDVTQGASAPQSKEDALYITVTPTAAYKATVLKHAVDKSIEVIRKRVDKSGTKEPVIQSQGQDRILVQIPGSEDLGQVRELLGKTARLTFHWVAQEAGARRSEAMTLPYASGLSNNGPALSLQKKALLGGEDIVQASVQYQPDSRGVSQGVVDLRLTGKGAKTFARLTQPAHIGRHLAIVLDKAVLSAPVIQAHIQDGRAVITGGGDLQEAQNLALMLNSGALPVPLEILEEKIVGPSLGNDSIVSGARATLCAIGAVAVWMLLVYSFFGLFTVAGILCNVCFLIAGLVWMGAVLTLPGLAGIALTVGISVDANVLINERIREEIQQGASIKNAIETGYKRALPSIIDSNCTTLIGSVLLYLAGTGPVKGFAITMALGILISLFTAITLTRMLVGVWVRRFEPKTLGI